MVLKIGEKIRTLRRKLDITQEQLAEKLGTSPQSVSRWENGVTYPDLEQLPALARILSVTTDELLGIPNKEKEQQCADLAEQLRTAYRNEKEEEAVRLLTEIRRDYTDILVSPRKTYSQFHILYCVYNMFHDCKHQWLPETDILRQLRLLTEDILASGNKVIREEVIRHMVLLEDDEHIEAFLDANSTDMDFSKDTLLEQRYRFRREFDKLNGLREKAFCSHMENMFARTRDIAPIRCEAREHWNMICWKDKLYFDFLHSLRNITPDPLCPVSGNGKADGWAGKIIMKGVYYAHALASAGDTEQAFLVLDDILVLTEQVWHLPEGTVLSFSTPAIRENTAKLLHGTFTITETGYHSSYSTRKSWDEPWNLVCVHSNIVHEDITPVLLLRLLRCEDGFCTGFGSMRTDSRFEGYLNRLQALLDMGAAAKEN